MTTRPHAQHSPLAPRTGGESAVRFRLGTLLLALFIAQSGCAAVGDEHAPEAPETNAQAEVTLSPKVKLDDVTVTLDGQNFLFERAPNLEQIWDGLAQATRTSTELSFRGRVGSYVSSFVFGWARQETAFAADGVIPDRLLLETVHESADDPLWTMTLAIDGVRFLAALRDLATEEFDAAFAPDAVAAMLGRAAEHPDELTAADYVLMARVFYATVIPAFSHEIRAEIAGSLARGTGLIGLAAHALAGSYRPLRQWAVRHRLLAAQATFVLTTAVAYAFLSDSALDMIPELWMTVARAWCG